MLENTFKTRVPLKSKKKKKTPSLAKLAIL